MDRAKETVKEEANLTENKIIVMEMRAMIMRTRKMWTSVKEFRNIQSDLMTDLWGTGQGSGLHETLCLKGDEQIGFSVLTVV